MKSNTNSVPAYTQPSFYQTDGSFTPGEKTEHSVTVRENPASPSSEISFTVDDQSFNVLVIDIDGDPSAKEFWTIIHYLRDYGVHGCWKERLTFNKTTIRLGAMYCIGPFELTERETSYNKYGEYPYEP